MHYSQLFGRAIKAEYLSLGTLLTAGTLAFASMSGGKKSESSGGSVTEVIQKAKEAIPLNAGSRYVGSQLISSEICIDNCFLRILVKKSNCTFVLFPPIFCTNDDD